MAKSVKPATFSAATLAAARQYIARRDRRQHPAGTFDGAGRWYPSAAERCSCCDAIRNPSRAFPYSYMVHCRTADHVAALNGVEATDVRRAARAIDKGLAHEIAVEVAAAA